MKRILNIAAVMAFSLLLASCHGAEGELELTLKADRTSILADGSEAVVFSVMLGSEDVTSEAEITCINDGTVLESNTFSTTVAGSYSFRAKYGEYESMTQAVVAEVVPAPEEKSKYRRNILIMEFTGQWCAQCPTGWRTLYFYLTEFPEYKDITYVLALHDGTTKYDEFDFPVQREIHTEYEMPGLPCALIDMRDKVALNSECSKVMEYFDRSINEGPHCGVAVSSTYDQTAGKAEVTIKVTSEKGGKYRLAVYVVEDGLVAKQQDGSIIIPDYTHNHVARKLVSESYKGDSLGEIATDAEVTKTYEIPADPAWNPENVSLYAVVIDSEGIVNNMAACEFVNGNTDYALADNVEE